LKKDGLRERKRLKNIVASIPKTLYIKYLPIYID
jgi:hypothetical protein